MSDFRTARTALGARLRELRAEAGLHGNGLAARMGWAASKTSKIETGKQAPRAEDLELWVEALGAVDVLPELVGRLKSLEAHYAVWRRQLAGCPAVGDGCGGGA
ncbi:helix-turn-helix domain-containing protein [Streptomyces sp. NPDC001741]|uniref:helix-turn-helix domain-containing protein n=1 Tax=unclassified Streptomyces TaxID=2593676 RepID=UPI00367DFC31